MHKLFGEEPKVRNIKTSENSLKADFILQHKTLKLWAGLKCGIALLQKHTKLIWFNFSGKSLINLGCLDSLIFA